MRILYKFMQMTESIDQRKKETGWTMDINLAFNEFLFFALTEV